MADAPVASGPGALARRTDRGPAQKLRELPDAQYGEAATYRDLQQAAPLAQTPGPSPADAPIEDQGPSQVPVGLDAPSERPDEPVTAGAPSGPGPNTMDLPAQDGAAGYRNGISLLQQLAASNPDNTEVQYLLAQMQRVGM